MRINEKNIIHFSFLMSSSSCSSSLPLPLSFHLLSSVTGNRLLFVPSSSTPSSVEFSPSLGQLFASISNEFSSSLSSSTSSSSSFLSLDFSSFRLLIFSLFLASDPSSDHDTTNQPDQPLLLTFLYSASLPASFVTSLRLLSLRFSSYFLVHSAILSSIHSADIVHESAQLAEERPNIQRTKSQAFDSFELNSLCYSSLQSLLDSCPLDFTASLTLSFSSPCSFVLYEILPSAQLSSVCESFGAPREFSLVDPWRSLYFTLLSWLTSSSLSSCLLHIPSCDQIRQLALTLSITIINGISPFDTRYAIVYLTVQPFLIPFAARELVETHVSSCFQPLIQPVDGLIGNIKYQIVQQTEAKALAGYEALQLEQFIQGVGDSVKKFQNFVHGENREKL